MPYIDPGGVTAAFLKKHVAERKKAQKAGRLYQALSGPPHRIGSPNNEKEDRPMPKKHPKSSWPYQKRPSFKASTHHGRPHKIARKAVAKEASALKHIADKAASDMKRMAEQCKADIRKAKSAATRAAKKKFGAGPKRKKHKGKKKDSHKKPHKTGFAAVRQPTFHGGFGHAARKEKKARKHGKKKPHAEKSVSASALIRSAGGSKKKGMQRWVCEAPVRTGCGGGARGGHVRGDRRMTSAVRFR